MDIEMLIERLGENTDCWTDKVHGYADLRLEASTALSTLQAENTEMQKQLNEFSEFLCHMTGGLLSKTNYTAQEMVTAAEGYQQKVCGECDLMAENEKLRGELEQVKRERDAAIGDIEEILAEIEQIRTSVEEPDVGEDWALSAICQKYCDRGGDHCWKDAGLGRCGNFRWKKPEKDESTCHDGVCDIPGVIVQDEATEFTRDRWDWLMGRSTRKDD